MPYRRWTALAAVVALALPRVALADPKDDARRHFVAGLEAAKTGQYETALQRFLAAQEAYPHPATLYNIARSYQDLNDLQNALVYYRLYRDAAPEKAADVDPVIQVLEAKIRQQSAPTATTSTGAVVPVAGVSPEILARLTTLASEMQAKIDEVNALAEAIASGAPAEGTTEGPTEGTGTGPSEGTGTGPAEGTGSLPEGGFLEDAYARVVVTASRYGQDPLDSPSAVTILTDEDIRLSGATNLADVLRRAVGVEAMQLAAGHTDISIRGFNRELNNKVLVLVDGRSIYIDFIGTNLWATLPVSLEEVERIEIIRGPGSAVYGANAVTGVVNIITRTPGEGGNVVHVEAGRPAYGQGTVLASGRKDATSYRFSAGYHQTGRWAKEWDPSLESREFFVEDQDLALETVRANGRVDRAFPNGFASLSAGYANGLFEYYNIGSLGDFYLDLQHHYVRGDVAYGPIHLRSFWNSDTGETNSWSAPTEWVRSFRSDIDADTVDVEIEGNQAFETGPMKHRFNMGVGYRFKGTELPGFIPDPVRENHVAAFVQEEATVSRVKVVGSLRADLVHPTLPIGETLSPRGAAIVRVADRTSVRLTGGTAFRAPNHVESYMEWVLPSSSSDAAYVLDYGDVNLNPERIATAEIGVHDESTSYHTADVSLYVNRLQDIIFLRSLESALASDTPIVDYDEGVGGYLAGTTGWSNLEDRYLGYGVEAEAEVFPIDGVDVFGNIAVERLTVSSGEGEPELDESASLVKVNAGASYRTPWRTDVALQANYASPQTWGQRLFDPTGQIVVVETEIPARLILSGRVVVRPLADDALEVGVGAWNFGALLDDDPAVHEGLFDSVQEHPKGQPVGARVFGSVSYRF